MTHTLRVALAGALLTVVVAVGCGDVDGQSSRIACGSYTVSDGSLPAEDEDIRTCFLDAFNQGEPAEVTITTTTIEGDPILTTYRVVGPDEVEVVVDASADQFAAVDTFSYLCTSVAVVGSGLTVDDCTTSP